MGFIFNFNTRNNVIGSDYKIRRQSTEDNEENVLRVMNCSELEIQIQKIVIFLGTYTILVSNQSLFP